MARLEIEAHYDLLRNESPGYPIGVALIDETASIARERIGRAVVTSDGRISRSRDHIATT